MFIKKNLFCSYLIFLSLFSLDASQMKIYRKINELQYNLRLSSNSHTFMALRNKSLANQAGSKTISVVVVPSAPPQSDNQDKENEYFSFPGEFHKDLKTSHNDNFEEEPFELSLKDLKVLLASFRFNCETDPSGLPMEKLKELLGYLANLKECIDTFDVYMTKECLIDLTDEYPNLKIPDIQILYQHSNVFFGFMHFAVMTGDAHLIASLIDFEADIFLRDSSGMTPFEFAIKNNFSGSARTIIEKLPSVIAKPFFQFPSYLHCIVAIGDVELLRHLHENLKCHFSIPIEADFTPLELALKLGKSDIAKYLLEQNAFYSIDKVAALYVQSFDSLRSHHNVPFLICSLFPGIRYVKDANGQDIFIRIVILGLDNLVEKLFDIGFDPQQVDYDVLDELGNFEISSELYEVILDKIHSVEYVTENFDYGSPSSAKDRP